jgi:hypothetical protein
MIYLVKYDFGGLVEIIHARLHPIAWCSVDFWQFGRYVTDACGDNELVPGQKKDAYFR